MSSSTQREEGTDHNLPTPVSEFPAKTLAHHRLKSIHPSINKMKAQ